MSRLRWEHLQDYVEIKIRPMYGLFYGIIFSISLLIIFNAGLSSIFELIMGKHFPIIIRFGWIVIWTCLIFFLLFTILYMIFGYQYVFFDSNTLMVCYKLGKDNISKPKRYLINDIQSMRIEEYQLGYKGKKVVKYRLIFNYSDQHVNFISFLTRQEAELLLKEPLKIFSENNGIPSNSGQG